MLGVNDDLSQKTSSVNDLVSRIDENGNISVGFCGNSSSVSGSCTPGFESLDINSDNKVPYDSYEISRHERQQHILDKYFTDQHVINREEVNYDTFKDTGDEPAYISPLNDKPTFSSGATKQKRKGLNTLQSYLFLVPHLCTLTDEQMALLHVMVREFTALDIILDVGQYLSHVMIVANGSVEVFNPSKKTGIFGHKRVASITAPNIFGVDCAVFGTPSGFVMRAGSARTTILLIPMHEFLAIFKLNTTLRLSVGYRLVDYIPTFGDFKEFCRSIFATTDITTNTAFDGYSLSIPDILRSYLKLNSIIHPHCGSSHIDRHAWRMALRRLPRNVTETFVFNFTRSLPPFIAESLRGSLHAKEALKHSKVIKNDSLHIAETLITQNIKALDSFDLGYKYDSTACAGYDRYCQMVSTADRRRCVWKVGSRGNSIVFLREGFTDIIDIVSYFCIHLIEARKLRLRLISMCQPSALEVISKGFALLADANDNAKIKSAEQWVVSQLSITDIEKEGLLILWPGSVIRELYNIVMHREEFVLKVDTSLSKCFDTDFNALWALGIRHHVLASLGLSEYNDLPENLCIDVVFGNAQTSKNLLCSFANKLRDSLLVYGYQRYPEVVKQLWLNEEDLLYWLITTMLKNNDAPFREEYLTTLHECGFATMRETGLTGLQVDVIDMQKLQSQYIDLFLLDALKIYEDGIRELGDKAAPHYILNVNYAFGAQADAIGRALALTFGKRIRSINVIGKATAVVGKRGDVILPSTTVFCKTALGEDSNDEIRSVNRRVDKAVARMKELLPDRTIHTGSVVTIPGKILINPTVMRYYHTIYNAVGFELEGSYFARQVEEDKNLGLMKSDMKMKFAYYVEEVPTRISKTGVIGGSSNAGTNGFLDIYTPLSPLEGVPPLYAIARSILENIFLTFVEKDGKTVEGQNGQ